MRKAFFSLFFLVSSLTAGKPASPSQELLRLSYQSFIYTKDLPNAYKVAQRAVKDNPQDLYWREQLAQVCAWLGYRAEAFENYYFIYKAGGDEKIRDRTIEYARLPNPAVYESLTLEKLKKKFNQKYFENLFDFYMSQGMTVKAATLLSSLRKNIEPALYLDLAQSQKFQGNLDEAEKTLLLLKESGYKGTELYRSLSGIYLSRRDFKKAYSSLKFPMKTAPEKASLYWQNLSDMAYLNMDYETGIAAAEKLYRSGDYRETDAENLFNHYLEKDRVKALEIILSAYKKFKKNYLFYIYASESTFYREDKKLFEEIEKNPAYPASKDYFFWLLKAENLVRNGEKEKAIAAYRMAASMTYDESTLEKYLWFLIDSGDKTELLRALSADSCSKAETGGLLSALAYGNMKAGNSQEGLYCFRKQLSKILSPSPSSLISYSDMLSSSGYDQEAFYYKYLAYQKIKDKNPEDLDYQETLDYIRLFEVFRNKEEYRAFLENIKKKIKEKDFKEIYFSYLSSQGKKETLRKALATEKGMSDWLKFSLYLEDSDLDKVRDMLDSGTELPGREKVSGYELVRDKDSALEQAFLNISAAPYDMESIRQFSTLVGKYYPGGTASGAYIKRDFLETQAYEISYSRDLYRGFNLGFSSAYSDYRPLKSDSLTKALKREKSFSLLAFKTDSFSFEYGYREAIKTVNSASAEASFGFTRINFHAQAGINQKTAENVFLELGGMKDSFSLVSNILFEPSFSLVLSAEENEYFSQDRKYAGSGTVFTFALDKSLRVSFPDLGLRPFASFATYNRGHLSPQAVINRLSPYSSTDFIPGNFSEYGLSFLLNGKTAENYRKRFVAPAEFSVSYNSRTCLNYLFSVSLLPPSGHLNGLAFKFLYAKGSATSRDKISEIDLTYRFR